MAEEKSKNKIYFIANIIALILIYIVYIIWDYFHHEWLEANLSKNMVWLGYFRYGNSADFMYSVDIILLSFFLIFSLLYVVMRRKYSKWTIIALILFAVSLGMMPNLN